MVDQHDRPRNRSENEKADRFWSAPRWKFLTQNYISYKTARSCYKPRLARVSCHLKVLAQEKSGQFSVRTQFNFFRAKLHFLACQFAGVLGRLALMILPVLPFGIVVGRKKRTVFGPHPCPLKCANSWDF